MHFRDVSLIIVSMIRSFYVVCHENTIAQKIQLQYIFVNEWSSPNYHKLKNILTYRFTWYWNAFSYSILFFEWKRLHGRIGILHKKHHIWQVNINIFYLHVNKLHIMDHINNLLTTYFLCKNSNKKAIKTYDSKY